MHWTRTVDGRYKLEGIPVHCYIIPQDNCEDWTVNLHDERIHLKGHNATTMLVEVEIRVLKYLRKWTAELKAVSKGQLSHLPVEWESEIKD